MSPEAFRDLLADRIPTPDEFLAFVRCQGWQVVRREDGAAALRGSRGDPLAVALARLLAREPYRTNVLQAAFGAAPPAGSSAATITCPGRSEIGAGRLDKDGDCGPTAPRSPSPRRVVLLAPDGTVEHVFDGLDPRAQQGEVRRLAREHPGRAVAAEWLLVRRDGTREWQRFLTAAWSPPRTADDATAPRCARRGATGGAGEAAGGAPPRCAAKRQRTAAEHEAEAETFAWRARSNAANGDRKSASQLAWLARAAWQSADAAREEEAMLLTTAIDLVLAKVSPVDGRPGPL